MTYREATDLLTDFLANVQVSWTNSVGQWLSRFSEINSDFLERIVNIGILDLLRIRFVGWTLDALTAHWINIHTLIGSMLSVVPTLIITTLIDGIQVKFAQGWKVVRLDVAAEACIKAPLHAGLEFTQNPEGNAIGALWFLYKFIKVLQFMFKIVQRSPIGFMGVAIGALVTTIYNAVILFLRILYAVIAIGFAIWIWDTLINNPEWRAKLLKPLRQDRPRTKWYAVRQRRPERLTRTTERFVVHRVIRRRDPGGNPP